MYLLCYNSESCKRISNILASDISFMSTNLRTLKKIPASDALQVIRMKVMIFSSIQFYIKLLCYQITLLHSFLVNLHLSVAYLTTSSIAGLCIIERLFDRWMRILKGFGRKLSRPHQGIIPGYAWRDWGKPRMISVMIAVVEIWKEHCLENLKSKIWIIWSHFKLAGNQFHTQKITNNFWRKG